MLAVAAIHEPVRPMPRITIYTTPFCPYCHMAKELLESKNTRFHEIDVAGKPTLRAEMREEAGGRNTVPQIWIGGRHIGGFDDLQALDRAGKLDPLLTPAHG